MSSYRPARFTGRVRLQSGANAFGCRVLLRVGDTPHVACETWTSSKGEFVLEVPPGRMPTGAEAQGGFTLEVLDGTGSILVRRGDLVARAGLVTHIAFTSTKRAMVTLPVALPLPTFTSAEPWPEPASIGRSGATSSATRTGIGVRLFASISITRST